MVPPAATVLLTIAVGAPGHPEQRGRTVTNAELAYQRRRDGIWVPSEPVFHRESEYDSANFAILMQMQTRHFWYRGRHMFLLNALRQTVNRFGAGRRSAVDLGGGCGGWVRYLLEQAPGLVDELALADSSLSALEFAGSVLDHSVSRYHVDLLRLGWVERWDVVFLLDVLEHLSQDQDVLRQIQAALRPGGLLLVTTPALSLFWSYNDEFAGHQRRYGRRDFRTLAFDAGFRLVRTRYFMFFLSPLVVLSRMQRPPANMTHREKRDLLMRTHRVLAWPLNEALALAFAAETPLGWFLPFPFGTSILGVFRKE